MKKRPLLYLLTVILVGVGIWLLERPDRGPKDDTHLLQFFPTLDPLQVQKLEISHLLDGVTLEKKGDEWTATPSPTKLAEQVDAQNTAPAPVAVPIDADPWMVGAALKALSALEGQSLISRDASAQPRLQVNDLGTHLRAYDAAGQVVADIYIGKTGPDLVSTAVRREGESEVYLARGYLGPRFPAVAEQWKKKGEAATSNEKMDPDKSLPARDDNALPGGQ